MSNSKLYLKAGLFIVVAIILIVTVVFETLRLEKLFWVLLVILCLYQLVSFFSFVDRGIDTFKKIDESYEKPAQKKIENEV